ncbi:hypothetical protein YC2023_007888 [Brassica napus]
MKAHIQETMFVGGFSAAVQARMRVEKKQKSKEAKEKNERESQPHGKVVL